MKDSQRSGYCHLNECFKICLELYLNEIFDT